MQEYPAIYTDAHGTESIVITNDGKTLRMVVRGVEFSTNNFETWEPSEGTAAEHRQKFEIGEHGNVYGFQLECSMPIPVYKQGIQEAGELRIDLNFRTSYLKLALILGDERFAGDITDYRSYWFETQLLEIQSQLPEDTHMLACINCLYSDYSPYGSGIFGDMFCFRDMKAEYLKVKGKDQFWPVHELCKRFVQETFLCSEFERRVPGTGYRG